jgi:NAD(P)-dependent dehydrogenase (short-subunit alcohol dehydrogenase family)
VIHNHAFDAPAIRLAAALQARVVHTLHLPPDQAVAAALRHAAGRGRPPAVAAVSRFQAAAWRRVVPVAAILPPGLPTRVIPWSPVAGDGAVFAGRLSPEKGAAEAIDIARAAGVRIDVYGDVYDAGYSRDQIDPRRGWAGVHVHRAVSRASLWTAMARAAVVLYPSRWDGLTAYNVSKYGVIGLTEAIAVEGREHGISAICVSPGAVDTQMLRRANPALRPGLTPGDVAELIVALLDSPLAPASGANIPLFSNA